MDVARYYAEMRFYALFIVLWHLGIIDKTTAQDNNYNNRKGELFMRRHYKR